MTATKKTQKGQIVNRDGCGSTHSTGARASQGKMMRMRMARASLNKMWKMGMMLRLCWGLWARVKKQNRILISEVQYDLKCISIVTVKVWLHHFCPFCNQFIHHPSHPLLLVGLQELHHLLRHLLHHLLLHVRHLDKNRSDLWPPQWISQTNYQRIFPEEIQHIFSISNPNSIISEEDCIGSHSQPSIAFMSCITKSKVIHSVQWVTNWAVLDS